MKNSAQWSALLGSLYMIAVDITSKIQGTPKRICITSGLNSFGVSFYCENLTEDDEQSEAHNGMLFVLCKLFLEVLHVPGILGSASFFLNVGTKFLQTLSSF